ncbi:hypothetical protein GDO86_010422 [Hymenochirus boettgeri]|uniref:Beta-defensin n=1 Tax=Hymenochirus boettgeri TaxID=247094 RepID=A0A8T2JK49_9PIPI|nr:hypothetical protein GDO86_010422 [Hymenochirus boettgeri]
MRVHYLLFLVLFLTLAAMNVEGQLGFDALCKSFGGSCKQSCSKSEKWAGFCFPGPGACCFKR